MSLASIKPSGYEALDLRGGISYGTKESTAASPLHIYVFNETVPEYPAVCGKMILI
jgi:hypothetical protein